MAIMMPMEIKDLKVQSRCIRRSMISEKIKYHMSNNKTFRFCLSVIVQANTEIIIKYGMRTNFFNGKYNKA